MGDTSETNTKVLSQEMFFFGVVLKMPVEKNHFLRDMGPFPRYCHIFFKKKGMLGKSCMAKLVQIF